MRGLTTIGFDADDTLWHSERAFRLTEARFAELLAEYVNPEGLSQRLLETEKRGAPDRGGKLGHFRSPSAHLVVGACRGAEDAPRFRQLEQIAELSSLLAEIDG